MKTCDELAPGRRLKGVDTGLAIVKAGAATVSVVIKQSAHHASVTTFRGQMQGCQACMRLSVNCGAWNRNKRKKVGQKILENIGDDFFCNFLSMFQKTKKQKVGQSIRENIKEDYSAEKLIRYYGNITRITDKKQDIR